MPTFDLPRHIRKLGFISICLATLVACSEDQVPEPAPGGIAVVSGDAQYTRKGTVLEEPVVARVELEDGRPAEGFVVNFQVIEGGGSLSRASATTNSSGRASVRWTVGPATGNNRLRITVAERAEVSAIATATSADYYCVEEDPAFTQKFTPAHDVVMLTRASSLTPAGAAVIRYDINFNSAEFVASSIGNYPDGTFINVTRDCVFAANGDLFVSWNHIHDEVMKVATDGEVSHFATLESSSGSEIAMTPNGVLVGCDERGPFYVTCRDTLFRFEGAIFTGIDRDAANNDALACDPNNGDIYFIYKSDRRLYRIPFDGTTAGPKEEVATLDIDESDGARGMVVDGRDGAVYLLVESANTRAIVQVTSAGTKTTVFDLSTLWTLPELPGIQSDLAIDRGFNYLYTLDTRHNTFLLYALDQDQIVTLIPLGDVNSASNSSEGERVGIDVIPSTGP